MITREVIVTIPGHPKPKGSLRCIGPRTADGRVMHQLIEDNKATKPWRGTIAREARKVTQRPGPRQPLVVELTSTLLRPSSHYGTGRNAGTLRHSSPPYPTGQRTGDVDKLARLVLDALQDARVLEDDCQVVEVISRKAYPDSPGLPDVLEHPGVRIRIYPLEAP